MKLIAALLITAVLLPAARPPVVLEWEQTTAAFSNCRVFVVLDSGARVEGRWLGATPGAFTMDVQRSHGQAAPARGAHTFPRTAVVRLRIQQKRIRGRVLGFAAGYAAGAAARQAFEGVGNRDHDNVSNVVMWSSVLAGLTLGWRADKKTWDVEIRPPRD
jgi:hypothetical protein